MVLEQFVSYFRHGKHARRPGPTGPQYRVCCTGSGHKNGDKDASLDITLGRSGAIVMNCKSLGCSIEDILDGVGLEKKHLHQNDGQGKFAYRQRTHWALKSVVKPISEIGWIVYLTCKDIVAGEPFDEPKLQGHLANLQELSAKLGRDHEAQEVAKRVASLINFTKQCIAKPAQPNRILLAAIFNLSILLIRTHDAK